MKVNPQGEWNNSKIVFDNGHVEHWLNGLKFWNSKPGPTTGMPERTAANESACPRMRTSQEGCNLSARPWGYLHLSVISKSRNFPEKQREVVLFNGVDLTGWEVYGTEKWYVKDNLLICRKRILIKQYGYLATREYFDDFLN